MKIRHSSQAGYTLLETLVAIVILTLSIVAPLSIASRALFSSSVARGEVTAFYLAQEAIEGVRNYRDDNGLSSSPWLTTISSCMSPNTCTIDIPYDTITVCNGSCPAIKYDSSNHLYQYQTGTDTEFNRTITLAAIPGTSDEVAISVTVTWNVGSISRSFVARENIFNWQ